jgi:hypothetical protein
MLTVTMNRIASEPSTDSQPMYRFTVLTGKDSRKNKLAILNVVAPGQLGTKTHEYLDIQSLRNAAGRDASASKM